METGIEQLVLEHAPRAARYTVKAAIRFRVYGENEWHDGETENISRTGLFLQSDFLPPAGAKVEMMFSFPAEILGRIPAHVVGQGRVIRQAPAHLPNQQPGIAATLDRYRLARSRPVSINAIMNRPVICSAGP